jgi:hypothetical protein
VSIAQLDDVTLLEHMKAPHEHLDRCSIKALKKYHGAELTELQSFQNAFLNPFSRPEPTHKCQGRLNCARENDSGPFCIRLTSHEQAELAVSRRRES